MRSLPNSAGLIVDSTGWGLRYLIVDTRNWWLGQHIRLDVDQAKVKASPAWDPITEIGEGYERRLHSHDRW